MSESIIEWCTTPFPETVTGMKFKTLAVGDNAYFYTSDAMNDVFKVFKGTCDEYHHEEYLNEVKQSQMIMKLIKDDKLNENYYLQMRSYQDCCEKSKERYFSSLIIFPKYKTSLQNLFINSKKEDIPKLKDIISETLTSYIILYQSTEMIHGNFTHNNILITEDDQPVIGGFGKMIKKPCKDHIKEFIWFIIPIRDYISGEFDGKSRPWLNDLIQPAFVKNLSEKNFLEIDGILNKPTASDIQTVFDYWIK